ncbi:MAG: hypothetical protein IJ002_04120 [Clostridia bacterium]|nr:hypothetical protein [Clostridia bacterium]
MNRKFLFLIIAILCALLTVSAFAADDTVYLDGTGATAGAYTDFKTAVSALPNGGTVIVSGDTTVGTTSAGVTLAAVGGKVTVTSENGAVLTLARSLTLASEMEFNNITINSPHTSNGRIIANGNKITIGENVVTVPASNDRYPTIIGGKASGTCTGSHVVIESGTWFVVFGASFGGTFNGNSTVDFTGGTIKGTLTGGNRAGNFTGTATLNIGGDAVVEYGKYDSDEDGTIEDTDEYVGIVATSMGLKSSTTAYTFKGNATVNISGNAQIASNVLGGSRYGQITTEGDITITVGGNAKLTRNIFGGGYSGGITTGENGIRVIFKDNATVGTNRYVCAGSYEDTASAITGNGYVEFNDNAKLTGALYVGGFGKGAFNGDTAVVINGGTVTSTISAQSRGGSVSGTQTVTLKGGNVGPVKGDVTIDLAADASVTMSSCDGAVTTKTVEGYEVVVSGTTYIAQEIATEPDPTTVYVDGTGETDGAYTSFEDAFKALSSEGGTVILTGDTQLGTTTSGVTLGNYKEFDGKITITSENGAKLIFARSLNINTDLEFKNIHIHCIIPSNLTANNSILTRGNTFTVGEGVTMTKDEDTIYPTIIGGYTTNTTYDSHIVVKGGTWQNIYGGGYSGTFAGNSTVEVSNAIVIGTLTAGSRTGTFSGNGTLILDLRGNKTVTASSFDANPTLLVDEGLEGALVGNTYLQREPVDMTPKTVFVDGTGKTDGAYTTFAEALANMPGGGTIVVVGDIYVNNAVTLATGGELLITSVYDGEDYTDVAAIKVANDIELGCAVTFKDIVLDKVATGNDFIFANGNALTIDEGVYCRNNLATNYIVLVGGAKSGTFVGDSSITVKSGYFRNIHGGNYNGTFKGNSTVNFFGGYVDNMITGGCYTGNFEGNATVNIGGDAVAVYSSSASGVQGGSCGSGNAEYTFVGDIHLNIYGNARINQNVYGTSRWPNVTTTGDVYITIKDDAFAYQNLYAGGYSCTLNGDTSVIMDNGWVGVNLSAGSRGGTVNGNTYLEINGGQINYFATNYHSSVSEPAGAYNISGGGLTGKVNGNTEVVVNGGDIYGSVYGGAIETGTVSGSSTVTVTGGSIMCGIYADGATAGSVAGTKTLNIDLSKGGTFAVGLSMSVNNLIGGGKLVLFPEAVVTTDTFSGNVELEINGIPQARNYITATNADGATVSYTAQGSEKFVSDGGVFGISSEGYYAKTKVVYKHLKGVEIYPRAGITTDTARIAADEKYDTSTVFYLAPGIYNVVVYHTQDDYKRVYLYVTGTEEEMVLDYTDYTPATFGGFEALHFYENTKAIYEEFYNTGDLVGYETPDSPYFNNDRVGTRLFTSNEEMIEFVNEKVDSCDWAYAFDLFATVGGTTAPVVIFTKDEIPEGATLEDVAKIVTATKGRDIMMVTAQVHGNEPSAGEGALAMISELCGEYGDGLLTGNVGAVIIIPRLNPDGSEAFTRENRNGVTVDSGKKIDNLNRDYAMVSGPEVSGVAYAFDLFEPTVLVDCHEAGLSPEWGESQTLTDVYDVGLISAGTLNTPFVDATAAIKGNYEDRGMKTIEILTEILGDIEKAGIRSYYYQNPMTFNSNNSPYGLTNGAYTFLVEVPGLSAGDAVFARRVFAHVTALKSIFDYAKNSNGEMAREVAEAREKVTLSAQKFDVDTPVVLQHSFTRHDSTTFLWNNPLVGSDATVRRESNITKYYIQDIAMKYRARPTAYVLAKGTAGLDKVLATLDRQGIDYYELKAGTTINLKKYSGTASTATLGNAADVTFEDGAYIVPVDGYKAYLTATLFEPECYDSGEEIATFVQAGYITAGDIYRSEESFIAAKLGLGGTYFEVATDGKEVVSAVVDGVTYDTVDTDGDNAYVVASESEAYTVTLNFTDGTSKTVNIGNIKGDMNGDGIVSIVDALMLIKAVVNDTHLENGDLNGDGKSSLIDVLRVMKLIAK